MKKAKIVEEMIPTIKQTCSICGEKVYRCDRCGKGFEEDEKVFCPENKYQMHYCEKCNKAMKGKSKINWIKKLPMAWGFKEHHCEIRDQLIGKKL